MNRNEAVAYLKDVLNACNDMSPDAVSFETAKNSNSTGYTVRIKGAIHESDRIMVKEIAKRHSLSVREEHGEVVVYRPK